MSKASIITVAGLLLLVGSNGRAGADGVIAVENLSSATVPETILNLSCVFPGAQIILGAVGPDSVLTAGRSSPVLGDECVAALQYTGTEFGPACAARTSRLSTPLDPPIIVITWTGDSDETALCSISFGGPSVPTGLTATTLGSAHIFLSWGGGGGAVSGYDVYRSSGGGAFARVGSTGTFTTAFDDLNLAADTTYTYQVTAALGSFESAPSNQASATTLAASGAPVAPGPLTVAAADDNSGAKVQLSWFDNSSNETSFQVERAAGSGGFSELVVLPSNTSSYLDRAVSFGTLYTYQVRACNSSGCSAYSYPGSARP